MAPSGRDKNGGGDKDKIPVTSSHQLLEELKAFKAALLVKETEHTWEAIDRAVKRFTAVTRGGACRYEAEYLAGLKDRELARAIVGCLSTERTQLSASTLLFLSAATRLGQSFSPLIFLYLPHIIRLLSRTNKLYISRATACLVAIVNNTRLAGVLPYLREGMLEKSPSHRKGCMLGLLCALGGSDPLFPTGSGRFESITVDKDIVQKKYTEDVETCIRIGARDRDIEVRKIAKKCWEIYRVEFSSRVASFAAPLTPIARKYLELPPAGQPVPAYTDAALEHRPTVAAAKLPHRSVDKPVLAHSQSAVPQTRAPPPRAPSPVKTASTHGAALHTVYRAPARSQIRTQQPTSSTIHSTQADLPTYTQDAPPLSASLGSQARPPPTLFARRVLPNSLSASENAKSQDQRYNFLSAKNLTTFAATSHPPPVASTSYAPAILSQSQTLQALRHVPSAMLPASIMHQRPSTAQSVEIAQEVAPIAVQEGLLLTSRPASACSHVSLTASSRPASPTKEAFKPSSSVSSQVHERSTSPVQAPPSEPLPMAAQALPPRPAPPLQRAVPAQIHRAPSRAARRASRVLPPSTDLQAFLSSTATDAASEFKWPAPTSVIVPEPVEVPHKRPASAMSAASEAPTSSNAVQMERILPDFLTQYVTIAKPLNQPSQGESEDVQHLESDKESAKKLQQPAPILSPAEVEVNEPHFAHEVLKSPAHKADSAQTEMSALVVQSGTPREPVIESAPSAATQQDSALNASEQSQKSEMVPPNSIVEVAHPLIEEATAVQAIETSGTLSNVEPEAALSIPSDKVPKASNLTERGLADIDTGVAAEGVTPQEHVVQPSEDVAPEPRMLDTAISTASKPVPSTTPVTLPLISASSRPRTAFMPRRRHRPAENVTPAAPSPSLPAHVLHPTSSVQGNKAAQWEPLAPMDAVNETSGPKNPLAASLGVRQSKALDSLSVTKQARSVSASVTVSNQAKASTVSSYAQAQSSRETSSRSVAGPSYARPTGGSERGAKPPPAKKQALSSSSGPSAGRLTTSTNASRSAANKPASGASAESVPPIGKGTSRTRPQGSIFSRLAAPTAASAARAKPRVASEARETFKKPASSTGILSKKNSTVSLKSSHGPTGTNAQPLRESTNKSTKTQAPVQTSGVVSKASNLHSLTNVPPSGDATTRDDNVAMEGQDQISGEDAPALAVVIEGEPMPSSKHAPKMIAPEREAENHRTDAGEEAQYQREQAQAETPVLAPSLKADETFHTASYVPLPCSPPGSDLPIILAELDLPGADENLQAVHNAITPVQLSGNAAVTAEGGDVSELPVQERLLSLSNNREDAVRPVGLSSSARDRKEKETVSSIPDTDSTPSFDLTHTATCTIDECADAEANHTADQTVIVNDLSDVQCAAPHEQAGQASHSSAASSPVQVSPSFSEQADTPKNYSQHSQNSMAFTSSNLSKSPTPESIPLPEDASLSLFVSPTKSMQDLLARSTGRQAEEESSPLLLEQEYHAPAIAAQYEYDETVLEASTVLPSRHTEPEHADVDKKDAPLPEQANPEQEQEGDEEEDEFALMISRELSSDSLEELASRWEESRVMAGSLGLLGNTNDDFDLENTPMRPKMLTRLSDGQSSDYGRAPFDTGAYTKDDEDAALDILLSMGNQATMDWTEKAAILSESMVLPAAKQSQSQEHLNDKKHNRGVLAEMYMTGDTPRVDRHRPRKSASDKSERATQGAQVRTESILQEGGIF